ncbi:MAG: type II secretion system protein [Patescibacteria group bacterium]
MNKQIIKPYLRFSGFTLVEMMAVVVILSILTGLTAFGFRGWEQGLAQRETQSDLRLASTAMENAKNFSAGYPSSLPVTFEASEGVTITYVGGNLTNYCLESRSTRKTSVVYYTDSNGGKDPKVGTCGTAYSLAKPSPSLSSPSSSSIVVTWSAVAGASSYSVRYGTSSASTLTSCSSSPCTITGLAADTDYVANVTATSAFTNAVSGSAGIKTQAATPPAIPAPSGASVAFTTSRVKVGAEYFQRYVMTASGGSCSVGTTEWKIGVTGGSSPSWTSWAWQTSNTKTSDVNENGIYSPINVTIYAKPRCVSGGNSTEGGTATNYNGSGGGGGGGAL